MCESSHQDSISTTGNFGTHYIYPKCHKYAVQINKHSINILMDKMDEISQDVNNLYNLTTSLATSLSYHQIILCIRSDLVNLQDSLSYIIKVSTHTMEYIDAATTGTLLPHILPIIDLRKMLSYIVETLPSTLHLPVSSKDTLHFYCYLHACFDCQEAIPSAH